MDKSYGKISTNLSFSLFLFWCTSELVIGSRQIAWHAPLIDWPWRRLEVNGGIWGISKGLVRDLWPWLMASWEGVIFILNKLLLMENNQLTTSRFRWSNITLDRVTFIISTLKPTSKRTWKWMVGTLSRFLFEMAYFQGRTVSFRECISTSWCFVAYPISQLISPAEIFLETPVFGWCRIQCAKWIW